MTRYAVISDIHGNVHAFQAVLAGMGPLAVDEMICLGDVVGYGPEPGACVDLAVKHCSVLVRGNHDEAVIDLGGAGQFNGAAREALQWTQGVLGPMHMAALNRLRPVEYLGESIMCVHDCPVPAPSDYVHDRLMAAMAFAGVDRPICLLGHTHVPAVFEAPAPGGRPGGRDAPEVTPADVTLHVPRDGEPIPLRDDRRYICNPGSVGQPRDADPRASFAVLDTDERTFTVHRQEYDVTAAQRRTQQAGLPLILADRLALGA